MYTQYIKIMDIIFSDILVLNTISTSVDLLISVWIL